MAAPRPPKANPQVHAASQLLQQGRLEEAAGLFAAVLKGQPNHHEGLFKMALTLNLQGKLDEARGYYQRVLALTPNMVEAHNNIGNILKDQGKFEAALASYTKAAALQPRNASVLSNRGDILRRLNRFDEAIRVLRAALAIKPDLTEASYNLSLAMFMLGDLAGGLPLYEKRLDVDRNPQYAASGVGATLAKLAGVKRWQGEPLQGKSLLVWTEQGIGDSLMMLRYLPLLKEKGAGMVMVYCGPELMGVFRDQADLVISNRTPLPARGVDLHSPIMSLPYAFRTTLDSIPNRVPYLAAPAAARNQWAARLRPYPGLKVGLAWAGNRALKSDHLRSMALERYAPLMTVPGVHFFSLQKGEPSLELQSTGLPIQDWMHDCVDIGDTAALIDNLDLVISVDTAVAHLTGALGKPIWLLNRFESEWRWMMERADSPWYPSMRIFRQPAVHDWAGVIARVRAALAEPAGSEVR